MNVKQLLTQRKADAEKVAAESRRLQLLQDDDEAIRIEIVMRKVARDLEGFEFSEGRGVSRWFQISVGDGQWVYVLFRYRSLHVNTHTAAVLRVLEIGIEWKGVIHTTTTPEVFVPVFADFLQKNKLI